MSLSIFSSVFLFKPSLAVVFLLQYDEVGESDISLTAATASAPF